MTRHDLKRFSCILGAMVLVLVLSLAAACRCSTPLTTPRPLSTKILNTGWTYEAAGASHALEELPTTLELPGDTVRFTRPISSIILDPEDYLLLRTRYAAIRVFADDAVIYEAGLGRDHALGSMWHFVPVEALMGADDLTVELIRYGGETEWTLFEILQEEPMNLRSELIFSNLPQLVFYVLTMVASAVMLVLSVFMAVYRMPALANTLSLAIFIFLSGSWVLLDCKISTIWGGDFAIAYFLCYAAIFLLPVPFLTFLCSMLKRKKCPLFYLSWVVLANALVCFLLHIAGIVTIRQSSITVQILCVAAMLVAFRELGHSVLRRRETGAKFTFFGTCCIFLCALIALGMHAMGGHLALYKTIPFGVGFVILMLTMIVDAMRSAARFWQDRAYSERYRMLAVQDSMTHLRNRNAFQMGIQQLAVVKPRRLAMVVLDLDCLKFINDHYGHHIGDQAICTVAQCIQDVFQPLGHCFRIGGDEFCVIVSDERKIASVPAAAERVVSDLRQKSMSGVSLNVSYGWASGTFTENVPITPVDVERIFKEADDNMYRYKQEHKCPHDVQ